MDNLTDDDICTFEEKETRLSSCKQCESFKVNDKTFTECAETGCLINLMITFKFKTCPIGKW